jgi:hypothetical protein
MHGTPRASIYACHPSGWFIFSVKFTAKYPFVLVLNGDYSLIRSKDAMNNGQENRVAIVFLPLHRSHKIQPLDVAFMEPFKTYYAKNLNDGAILGVLSPPARSTSSSEEFTLKLLLTVSAKPSSFPAIESF